MSSTEEETRSREGEETPVPDEETEAQVEDGINTDPDAGQAEVQEKMDEATEKGYLGTVPDPTPNENYFAVNSTATNDLPTPETDADLYDEARKASLGSPRTAVEHNSAEVARDAGGDQ